MTPLDNEIRDARRARVLAGLAESAPGDVTECAGATIEVGRWAVTATGPRLSAVLRALADHPLVQDGHAHQVAGAAWEGKATVAALLRAPRATYPTPKGRAATACLMGHEVETSDGRGRCHCGESIAEFGALEVE